MLTKPAATIFVRFATALLVVSVLVRLLPMSTASSVTDDMAIAVGLALVVVTSIYARGASTVEEREDRAGPAGALSKRKRREVRR